MTKQIRYINHFASPVPEGMQPKDGVEEGCGQTDCTACYEPATADVQVVRLSDDEE